MNRTIRALPNQSLLDIIIMQYGSLEAGMQFAFFNNANISMTPVTGDQFNVPGLDSEIGDAAALSYLQQNGIVIGTKGSIPPLGLEIILKPVMDVVPNATENPHTIGFYSYDIVATPDFIHTAGLESSYMTGNKINFETEERYVLGFPPAATTQYHAIPMTEKKIPYKLYWTVGFGYMMVWSDPTLPVKTITFKDIAGNEAYVSPVIVLDNISQNVVEYLVADISIEVVTASAESITVRLTRSHPPIVLTDFSHHVMDWLGDAAGGTPDPADPTNPNKRIVNLAAGNHTLGVKTAYEYVGVAMYPSSAFTMVVKVG